MFSSQSRPKILQLPSSWRLWMTIFDNNRQYFQSYNRQFFQQSTDELAAARPLTTNSYRVASLLQVLTYIMIIHIKLVAKFITLFLTVQFSKPGTPRRILLQVICKKEGTALSRVFFVKYSKPSTLIYFLWKKGGILFRFWYFFYVRLV